MEQLAKKSFPENYPTEVVEVINALSFHSPDNINIVGSSSLRSQLYASDYDTYQVVKRKFQSDAKALNSLVLEFRNIVQKLLDIPNTYIMDIKSGSVEQWRVIPKKQEEYSVESSKSKLDELLRQEIITKVEHDEAVKLLSDYVVAKKNIKFHLSRWNAVEIKLNRKKLRNGEYMTLQQAFNSPTITKIDVISLIANRFTEFSCIYQFVNKNKVLNPDPVDILKSVNEDIDAYMKMGNYAKVLKRKFLYAKYSGDLKTAEKLSELFNTDIGKLYNVVSDLKTLIDLIEEYPRVPIGSIRMEMDNFIQRLSNIYEIKSYLQSEPEVLDKINVIFRSPATQVVPKLKQLYEILYSVLQREAKKLI